jgi:hypothetical protein
VSHHSVCPPSLPPSLPPTARENAVGYGFLDPKPVGFVDFRTVTPHFHLREGEREGARESGREGAREGGREGGGEDGEEPGSGRR